MKAENEVALMANMVSARMHSRAAACPREDPQPVKANRRELVLLVLVVSA